MKKNSFFTLTAFSLFWGFCVQSFANPIPVDLARNIFSIWPHSYDVNRPNLTMAAGNMVINGDTLEIAIEVENNGTVASGAFEVGLFASENPVIGSSDFLVGILSFGSLAPGNTQAANARIVLCDFPDLADGTYTMGYFIDYDRQINESAEGQDNKGSFQNPADKNCASELPNLLAKSASLVVSGNSLTVDIVVANEGNRAAGESKVGIYASENDLIGSSDFLVGSAEVDGLAPGESNTLQLQIDLCQFDLLAEGTYTIGYFIDYERRIEEQIEGLDNKAAFAQKAEKNCAKGLPNLGTKSAALNISGNQVEVDIEVENTGQISASAFEVGIYASENTTISTSDFLVGKIDFTLLPAGASAIGKGTFDLCAANALSNGSYTIGYIIDYTKTIEETNEGDNNGAFPEKALKDCDPTAPDLIPQSPSLFIDGTLVEIAFGVQNAGDAVAGPFRVGVYASENDAISTSDILIGTIDIKGLAVNEVVDSSISIQLCEVSELADGSYFLGFILDDEKTVAESEEENNDVIFSQELEKQCIQPLPNLIVQSASLDTSGNQVAINLRIRNTEGTTAKNFNVGYYASENENISTSDFLLASQAIDSLPANSAQDIDIKIDLCSLQGLNDGLFIIGYILDYEKEVEESNEDDNSDRFPNQVQKNCTNLGPDLSTADSSLVSSDSKLDISVSVINQGTGPANAFKVGFYASNNASISTADFLIGEKTIGFLAAGATATRQISIDLCELNGLVEGEYTIGYIIDYEKTVAEIGASNNNGAFPGKVEKNCLVQGPNLTAKSSSLDVNGSAVGIDITVVNEGTARSGSFNVNYYASIDEAIDQNDFLLGTKEFDSLSPNGLDDTRIVINLCELLELPEGEYTIGYIIDPEQKVPETTRLDNSGTFSQRVEKSCGEFGANLAVSSQALNLNENIVEVSLTVVNKGTIPASAFEVAFYASKNTSISTTDFLMGTYPVTSLAPGEIEIIDVVFDLCEFQSLEAQGYTIGFFVDYLKVVPETTSSDNRGKFSEKAQKSCKSNGPNLLATNSSLTVTGSSIKIDLNVSNIGNLASGSFNVGIYASENTTISSFDFLIGEETIGALAPSASESISTVLDLCDLPDLPLGSFSIGIIVDHREEVAESNERDNYTSFAQTAEKSCTVAIPDLRALRSNMQVNDNVLDISLSLINQGTNASGAFKLGIYASNDENISPSDAQIGFQELNSIATGDSTSLQVLIDLCDIPALAAGTYTIGYIIDFEDEVAEQDETNNQGILGPPVEKNCIPPKANLAKGSSSVSINGNIVEIDLRVVNNGEAASEGFRVVFRASPDTLIDPNDVFLARQIIDPLQVGESINISLARDLCEIESLIAGEYFIGYIIDDQENVTESNEDDNTEYFAQKAEKNCVVPKPNLLAASANFSQNESTLQITVQIENAGTADASSFKIGYYISENTSIESSDFLIGTGDIAGIAAGNTSTLQASIDLCTLQALAEGTYTLGYFIDYELAISESEESDNHAAFPQSVTKNCIVPQADLSSGNSTIDVQDNRVQVSLSVLNTGNLASGTFEVGIYASENTSIQPTDFLLETLSFSSIPGGDSSTAFADINLCDILGLAKGTYTIGFVIDNLDEVNEGNEGDNDLAFNPTVENNCIPQKPNLAIDFTNVTHIGSFVEIDLRIINSGGTEAGGFQVSFFASENPEINPTDFLIGTETFESIVPGNKDAVSKVINLCEVPGLPSGTYTVGYIIDPGNQVEESDETDNSKAFGAQANKACVQFAANLTTRSANLSISNTIANINLSVINDGIEPSGNFTVGYYISTDTDISTGDIRVATQQFESLAPGAFLNKKTRIDFCEGQTITPGEYTLGYIIDYPNDILEVSEGDNFGTFSQKANIDCTQRGPNLRTTLSRLDTTGSVLDIHVTIANTGGIATGTFAVGFFASENSSISASDFLFAFRSLSSIPAGDSLTETLSVDLCTVQGLAPWEYTIGYILDIEQVIEEFDEEDNITIFGIKAEKNCAKRIADLQVNSATLTLQESMVGLNLGVRNDGTGASGAFKVGYYASENALINKSDFFLAEKSFPDLQPGQTISLSSSVDLCSIDGLAPGEYTLGYIIDYENLIEEADEQDNQGAFDPSVTKSCVVPLANLIAATSEIDIKGTVLQIGLSLSNEGALNSEAFDIGYFASKDSTIDDGDFLFWTTSIPSLSSGASILDQFSVDLCTVDGFEPDTYTFGYILDYAQSVEEEEESDNVGILLQGQQIQCSTPIDPALEKEGLQVSIFPNPFPSTFFVHRKFPSHEEMLIEIHNHLGQGVLQTKMKKNQSKIEVDLHNFPAGIYYLKLRTHTSNSSYTRLLKLK